MHTHDARSQASLTPRSALDLLREGNLRFQNNIRAHRDLLEQVNITSQGQFPFAVVLGCIDSRTSAELIFDQGLGDIFSVRVAGNVLDESVLGSIEYACAVAGSKLIVILGHSACGAVGGACDGVQLGHITQLVERIYPALEEVKARGDMPREQLVDEVAAVHVQHVVRDLQQRSPVLSELIRDGQVGLVSAMYSVSTGEVVFGELTQGGDG